MTSSYRNVERVVPAMAAMDGAGVRLKRSLGTPALDLLDPFLLLDEFRSDDPNDYIAGFPDHPHRGFETVTYMLAGAFEHKDHLGNTGHLGPGSVQWMTAGRGIVHSEMPLQEDGLVWGFQLWINLPADKKMVPPRYQDIPGDRVGEVQRDDGAIIRVIAGEVDGIRGPIAGIATAPIYLDVRLPPGVAIDEPVPLGHSAFAYAYEGEGRLGGAGEDGQRLSAAQLAVLGDGERLTAVAGDEGLRFLLIAAKPIREPVARYGPFVMNTREELIQAFRDFEAGTLQQ